jgi:hypothetical protein
MKDPIVLYKEYLLEAANVLYLISEEMETTPAHSISPRQVGDWTSQIRDVYTSVLKVIKSRQGMHFEVRKLKSLRTPILRPQELRFKYVRR